MVETLFRPYLQSERPQITLEIDHFGSKWTNAVLVIVCARLGLKQVEPEYLQLLQAFFACSLNMGLLGGKPGEAYYLVGIQGQSMIFLDPHCTQDAVNPANIRQRHTSYHESSAKRILYTKLDASVGFAFLLKKDSDFQKFQQFMHQGKLRLRENWVFHTMESKPRDEEIKSQESEAVSNGSSFDCIDEAKQFPNLH